MTSDISWAMSALNAYASPSPFSALTSLTTLLRCVAVVVGALSVLVLSVCIIFFFRNKKNNVKNSKEYRPLAFFFISAARRRRHSLSAGRHRVAARKFIPDVYVYLFTV